ncbi:MAG: methylmalonyl-CoA mutase family protein [Myxococcaceae bacterium]|nr:methylmalonyl-CoA mutase family protein [Myxococcaceae bacterium]
MAKSAKKVSLAKKKSTSKARPKVKAVATKKRAVAKAKGPTKKPLVHDPQTVKHVAAETTRWRKTTLGKSLEKMPTRRPQFLNDSGIPLPDVFTPADRRAERFEDLALPGEFPFTRGTQPTMYRSRLWTMRQFAGFGGPADTNRRFKYLISQGMTGLSTAFDRPALMGYDADHPMSRGEVGKEGVAISTHGETEKKNKARNRGGGSEASGAAGVLEGDAARGEVASARVKRRQWRGGERPVFGVVERLGRGPGALWAVDSHHLDRLDLRGQRWLQPVPRAVLHGAVRAPPRPSRRERFVHEPGSADLDQHVTDDRLTRSLWPNQASSQSATK